MHRLQFQQRTAAAPAARPLARSMLVPRSTPLSPGGIAGAVVGSVVGALLIAFCLFPFVVRARRRRLARHDDPGLAETGQGPGGPIFNPQDLDDNSYKRCSGSGAETGPVHDVLPTTTAPDLKPQSTLPHGVTVEHGLLSPASSHPSPTDLSSSGDGPADSPPTTTAPTQLPHEASSQSHNGSRGTVGRESTREFSVSDSHGPPSRELTGITSVGITEEPESFDRPSGSPEPGHFPHLKESLRSLIHRRRSSHQRRDSKRSTHGDPDGARSPSVITNDLLPQPTEAPSGLEIDTETPGLAWDYYHDPTLGIDVSENYSQPISNPTSAGTAPPTHAPTSAPLDSQFPGGQIPVTGVGATPSAATRPTPQEPDAISPDSDATVTSFSRQSTLLQGKKFPEPLQRTDSLPPPTIVADLPSPPLPQYSIGPSGNPMEMMKPTNPTESAWMLEHEMRMIQNSPPPPPPEPIPPMSTAMDDVFGPVPEESKPEFQFQYQPAYQSPYQSPPLAALESGMQTHDEGMEYYNANVLATSDYSTPPPSTGPSNANTPDTRLTPFTASPSPPAEVEATINSHLTVSPGLTANLSPSSALSPSPGLSPTPSRGRTPGPTPGRSPNPSPGRSQGPFTCEVCGAVKESFHQFKQVECFFSRIYHN